jgi:hypothetical protein
MHYALCTSWVLHCTLHTAHCTLHTAHCTLHTAHCTLHTAHCTLHTAHCKLQTANCKLHSSPQTSWVRLILADPNSRNLLCFLLLNFSFAFVELFYGVWTNSLGLISDSFHMFFDCTGLMAGLVATVITKVSFFSKGVN